MYFRAGGQGIMSVAAGILLYLQGSNLYAAGQRVLTEKEIEQLVAQDEKAEHDRLSALLADRHANVVAALRGRTEIEAGQILKNKKQVTPIVPVPQPTSDPCADANKSIPVFVRRNSLDTFQLGAQPVPVANAKGASVSLTQDNLSHSNTVQINGRVQAIVAAQHPLERCVDGHTVAALGASSEDIHTGYVIAPFVDAQGTANNPKKPNESSALQGGVDFQFQLLGGPILDAHYITLTPYYQTDFRSEANIQGLKGTWDFIERAVNLGGSSQYTNPYFDWFWQLRAEYDGKQVTSPGLSGLTDSRYSWVGGTVQTHITFFPTYGGGIIGLTPSPIADRFYLNAMANYYRDASRGQSIHLYEIEFGYNLSEDGKSSVSIKYDRGIAKDTLVDTNKYVLGLNYKY